MCILGIQLHLMTKCKLIFLQHWQFGDTFTLYHWEGDPGIFIVIVAAGGATSLSPRWTWIVQFSQHRHHHQLGHHQFCRRQSSASTIVIQSICKSSFKEYKNFKNFLSWKSNASLRLTITATAVDTVMRQHCRYGGNQNRNKAIKDILDKTTQLKIGNQNLNQGHWVWSLVRRNDLYKPLFTIEFCLQSRNNLLRGFQAAISKKIRKKWNMQLYLLPRVTYNFTPWPPIAMYWPDEKCLCPSTTRAPKRCDALKAQ